MIDTNDSALRDRPRGGTMGTLSPRQRWIRLALGSVLLNGARRGGPLARGTMGRTVMGMTGAYLTYGAVMGRCPVTAAVARTSSRSAMEDGITVSRTITIGADADEIYHLWRNLDNLPLFMEHLDDVEVDGERSRWTIHEGPLRLSWNATITEDVPGRRIAWRSIEGSDLHNEGSIDLRPAPGGRGTELELTLRYVPMLPAVAVKLAPVLRRITRAQLGSELTRLKQWLETGEIATAALHPDDEQAARRRRLRPTGNGRSQEVSQ